MTQIKSTLILIALLFIQACGYHLRSSIDLPEDLKSIYIEGASGTLRNSIKGALRFSEAKLVGKPEKAGMLIKVIKEKMRRRVISVGSTGRANEYELNYDLDFVLLDAEGKALSKIQTIEINKDYFNDQEDVLAKGNEEQVIRNEIYRQAVQSIINQSRIVLEKINN